MNKTVIFITHDLDEALRIGDRIVLMRHGEIVQIGTPEEILTNPADAYVERFVEDVNLGKVLTAETVMRKAETIVLGKDGIRVAGKKMRDKGIPTLVVVDRKRYFKGMVTADQVKEAFKKEKKVEDILVKDVVKVKKDTPLQTIVSEMGQHADATIPAVVVDDEDRVLGIVGRGAVWAALAGQGGDSE